jgi:hypothetical protein
MDARYLLARLNSIEHSFEKHIQSTGEKLSPMMVAATLAGLPKPAYLLLRYIWCQDETVYPDLFLEVEQMARGLALSEGWHGFAAEEKIRALSTLALHYFNHRPLCKTCNGTGIVKIAGCPVCFGSGKQRLTHSVLANAVGIHRSNWLRSWDNKFNLVLAVLSEWEERGSEHISRRLCA